MTAHDDRATSDTRLLIVNPPQLGDPIANGYSTAIVVPAGATLAFVSGQGGQDSRGRLSPDFREQVEQAYANLTAALDALGARPDQVAKLTVFVVDHDMSKLGVLSSGVTGVFAGALPAQTSVPVPRLAVDGMLFEVDAVVMLD